MRNILSRVAINRIPWVTKLSQRTIIALALLLFLSKGNAICQNEDDLDDNAKSLIFMSIVIDGPNKYGNKKWDDLLDALKNYHDNLHLVKSNPFNFVYPNSRDTIRDSYSLQIFKIVSENSRNKLRYLLRYSGFNCTGWLRVSGYADNDIKVFFDYLIASGVKKKDLNKLIEEWENADPLFTEVDFKCLLDGYYKNRTTADCYVATSYVERLDLSVGFIPLGKNEINAVFSRIPMSGSCISWRWVEQYQSPNKRRAHPKLRTRH